MNMNPIYWRNCKFFLSSIPNLGFLHRCSFLSKVKNSTSSTAAATEHKEAPLTKQEVIEISDKIPIEKRSLSRGLTINAFEKDFVIYPEYRETKDIERIKTILNDLNAELSKAFSNDSELSSSSLGTLPRPVLEALVKNGVFAGLLPSELGGLDFCRKDMLQLSECFGRHDLSTFTTFNSIHTAANLISMFGTQQQKERYLAGIATGQWQPAICIRDETSGITPTGQVYALKGDRPHLSAVKVDVVNAKEANLFLVYANRTIGDEIIPACYIVERDSADSEGITSAIKVKDQVKTGGLRHCNFSTVFFDNVPLDESNLLGRQDNAGYMMEELTLYTKTFYGAAVVGFVKRVLAELCSFANQQVKGNLRLSDSHPIQKTLTELGIQTYVLESMVYYVGGLADENLFLMQDIENSVIQRFANKAIRQSIMSMAEVAGLATTNMDFPYEQMIRDAVALMALTEPDLHLVRRITIPAIESFVEQFGGLKHFSDSFKLSRILTGYKYDSTGFIHPKLIHFIGEHVHPSLHPASRELEYSMTRLSKVIERLTEHLGVYLNTDYTSLESISTLIENNLAMISTIARASRSYCLGLKNSEDELNWTIFFCKRASENSKNIALDIINDQSLLKLNPRNTEVGFEMLRSNGYSLENPFEKNW